MIFNFQSNRQEWENEIYFRSTVGREVLDKAVIPVIACAIFAEAVGDTKSGDILPEANTSKDVMLGFVRQMDAATELEALQTIGKRVSAAGADNRLVDADLAALRAKYRVRAEQVQQLRHYLGTISHGVVPIYTLHASCDM